MVFNTVDFDILKNKENILHEKEEGKYFCSKIVDARLYTQTQSVMAPYLTDTIENVDGSMEHSECSKRRTLIVGGGYEPPI